MTNFMIWLKENWWKLGLLFAVWVYIAIFAFQQYVATRQHNLGIINTAIQCSKTFEGEGEDACAEVALNQKIRIYKKLIW